MSTMRTPSGTTSPLPGTGGGPSSASAGPDARIPRPMGACASYPNCAASPPADMDALRPTTRRRPAPQPLRTRPTGAAALHSAPIAAAVDLEELGTLHAAARAAERGVEVHYEDGGRPGDVPHRDRRVAARAAAACAPDACQPLGGPQTPAPVRGKRPAAASKPEPRGEQKRLQDTEEDQRSTSATDDEGDAEEDERCCALRKLCMCELRRHRGADDCWLAAYGGVYDVTGILRAHPGGARCLLRKAGGPDCSSDMDFHTKKARRMMDQCFIGKLEPCGEQDPAGLAACALM